MSETPEKKEAPPAVAPSFGAFMELSLTALVNAPGAFAKLAAAPAPAPAVSFFAALSWGLVFFALNLTHAALANSALLSAFQPWQIAAAGAAGLGAWSALFLLGSCVLYGVGRTLGGAGDFDRGLCVAAVALAAAPVSALCSWLPAAWFLPSVIAAWIAACGLRALFLADAWAARGVCAAFAGLALVLQYGAGVAAERYAAAAAVTTAAAASATGEPDLREFQQQMQNIQALTAEAARAGRPQTSGLDLLRGGDAAADVKDMTPEQIKRTAEGMTGNAEEMNKSMLAMLDSILPLISSPAMTAKMTPQQKSDFAEINKMVAELKTAIANNEQMTEKERQAKMQKVQDLTMRMMTASLSAIPSVQARPALEKKK